VITSIQYGSSLAPAQNE